ncbi:hypothetical protein RhiLY_04017 [Ceratobasidium sp. AG-Ba]|nr:hypothetical protein RhiLY_04017 [Ceratobasidium sp. AG-Ba]
MALGQLVNAYAVIGMLSAFGFRTVRKALPHDPIAQDRIIGASLTVLTVADVSIIAATVAALPWDVVANPSIWNGTVYGNIVGSAFFFVLRMSWFAGIGRESAASAASKDE